MVPHFADMLHEWNDEASRWRVSLKLSSSLQGFDDVQDTNA